MAKVVDYEKMERLGQGSFGTVYKAKHMPCICTHIGHAYIIFITQQVQKNKGDYSLATALILFVQLYV